MGALAKAISKPVASYRVDIPFKGLSRAVSPLRGNLIVAIGSPGIGKSAFSLNWALRSEQSCCLISLDTDLHTQGIRAAGILSGTDLSVISKAPEAWSDYLDKNARMVRAYDFSVDAQEIAEIVEADGEFWGETPALTIVDNVSNLVSDGDYQEYRRLFVDLHRVARKTNTCVLALHHVTRKAKPGEPLQLNSGQFAGEQEAELVLGLWTGLTEDQKGRLNISVLKNRQGQADASGQMYVPLVFDQSTMTIRDETATDQARAVLLGGSNV